MPRIIDLTGQRFGKLTVIERTGTRVSGKFKNPVWKVVCDCGTVKEVWGKSLRQGTTRSCGCTLFKHRMYGAPEYKIWSGIIGRCTNERTPGFKKYGAIGVKMCQRWRESFAAFYEDMGPRPSPVHSIDRYPDKTGNYEPTNCRWATPLEQGRNKRNNHLVEANGKTATISEWAQITGLKKTTIRERLRRGWSDYDAVTQPPKQSTTQDRVSA